jgi:hypothetical protein
MLRPKFLLINTLVTTVARWFWARGKIEVKKKVQEQWDKQRDDIDAKFGKRYIRVECADGFSMSVQAGIATYSTPRTPTGPYSQVEVGFPTYDEYLLKPYFEGNANDDMTKGVYAYVPVWIVTNVLAKHGGMVSGEVPSGVVPLKAPSIRESKNNNNDTLTTQEEQNTKGEIHETMETEVLREQQITSDTIKDSTH